MKIKEALPTYYDNRKTLVEQTRKLYERQKEAESKFRQTGDRTFSEEAATLQLSLIDTQKAFEENQKVIDSLMEEWSALVNMESSRQAGEAMEKSMADLGKIMTVFRRMAKGDTVPASDEKRLMEYNEKMYTAAKNMQAMAQQLEKEHKKHKSLWEDEEEEQQNPDPTEVADESEYSGELPEIEIPDIQSDVTE